MHIGLNAKKKKLYEYIYIYINLNQCIMKLRKNIFKGMVMILIICEFSYEIPNLVNIYFLKSKANMGEREDAAFASCWRSAAMETKQIWT